MKDDFVYKEMEQSGADGVDFHNVFYNPSKSFDRQIYSSYTKKEWETENIIPKTGRSYWKSDGSTKIYLTPLVYTDSAGGHHDNGCGWNPRGDFCGECSVGNCSKCGVWERECNKEDKHAHWEIHYVCSLCGESVRSFAKECPFCHAVMDEST